MGNGNKKPPINSFSVDDLSKYATKGKNKDVAKWSSSEVQHWIKHQCKHFELKKSIAEQFQMNGQALMLLTKHDFIRRSPQGGEILFYALQRLISNPNKVVNLTNDSSNSSRNGTNDKSPRIVEVSSDNEEVNGATNSLSPKPIVEEPDDPPAIRRSNSDAQSPNYQQQSYTFVFNPTHFSPPVVTMPSASAAAYFQQQRRVSNGYAYAHNHPHFHMHQHAFYPQTFQQYHPMMSAQGILIEIMDNDETSNTGVNGAHQSRNSVDAQEALYMVTINGQRYIMNEAQVTQLVTEVHQHEAHQRNLQQQQFFQQQQQLRQQQQHRRHF